MKALFIAICAAWAIQPMLAQEKASLHETEETVTSYPFSDPDPVADPSDLFYPYFRFDGFSAKGKTQAWKSVVLENAYISLKLYPQVGGKVWGAVDKTSGREFIYNNHVVKFRDIAMRGPWTSGGIEFNFGIIGHAPTSSTPVDYYTEEKTDGSVSCHIASYEWVTRTYWNVEVNLPRDKAYFTTTTTWYNQSSTDQPYYQWMNAGYQAAGNAQFCYPGNYYIGHGGELATFPIDAQGHDLSWYKNNNFGSSKSEHVLGFYNDFYGIYWHDTDFGSVHHAAYDEKLGMKIFLWSQARDGAIWEELLTDKDGQYVELQSGRMYNQPASASAYSPFKHYAFAPGMTDRWTEFWFPVKGIGGISKASRVGALHVERAGGDLKLAFSPLQSSSTVLRIYDGEREVKSLPIETHPLQPWNASLAGLASIPQGRLRVIIGDRDLVYTERPDDYLLNRPKQLPADFDWNGVYGLYTQGEQWMNQKEWGKAEAFLKRALDKEPYFAPALNRLASLYEREGRLQDALDLLGKSLSLDAYDGEANYLYGLCNRRLGKKADARDGFSVATYSATFRTAAYAELAIMSLADSDWAQAVHYARKSLGFNQMNLDARMALIVACRKSGQPEMAREEINRLLAVLPLYHPARFEQSLLDGDAQPDKSFSALIRNELPAETYLELSGWYEKAGCTDEAIAALDYAAGNPIALYKQAYLHHKKGDAADSRALLQRADGLSPAQVFPFRSETLPALSWAASQSGDWKIRYYEGLICWANRREKEALDLLESCGSPDYAPFYLSRAKLRRGLVADKSCLDDLLAAERTGRSWRTGFALLDAYASAADWQAVVETGKGYMKSYPDNYYIGLKLARGYCETGRYAECLALLKRLVVLPNEGAYAGRALYRAANLHEAMNYLRKHAYGKADKALAASKRWPENLGVGKPYDDQIDSRVEDWIESRLRAAKGDSEGARRCLERVAAQSSSASPFVSGELLSAWALRELGRTDEADKKVAAWSAAGPANRVAEWCAAIYNNDQAKAASLLESRSSETDAAPWEASRRDADFDLVRALAQ